MSNEHFEHEKRHKHANQEEINKPFAPEEGCEESNESETFARPADGGEPKPGSGGGGTH